MNTVYRILVINPGSTSTKIAVFENERVLFLTSISHSEKELKRFSAIFDQREFRLGFIEAALEEKNIDLEDLNGIVGRGGLLHPVPSGAYGVNEIMRHELKQAKWGEHACNLGGIIAFDMARPLGIPALIADPVVVDEMTPVARISGMPELERRSVFHALNQKAVARKTAQALNRPYESLNLIVVHMGGGISVGVHEKGRVVDVNNAFNGDGPFAPERSGSVPIGQFLDLCFSEKWTKEALKRRIVGDAGLVAYLGTHDMRKCKEMISRGDSKAKCVYEAMAYQVAKEIGSGATVLNGDVDGIVLTGGLAHDDNFVTLIREKTEWIGRVLVFPGESEMEALALAGLRVLRGEEEVKDYRSWDEND